MAAIGCKKEKYVKPMSEAAYATVDRACGVYRLMSMDWTGDPVDLDGDGVAQESLLEECLAGNYGGYFFQDDIIEWTLSPISMYKYEEQVFIPFFHGNYIRGNNNTSYYSLSAIKGKIQILEDGTLDIQVPEYQLLGNSTTPDEEICAVRDITVSWEPDGDFLVAGTTLFRDERTGENVTGRETLRYHCVSTKEKKKR